jgi:hypothetical protein
MMSEPKNIFSTNKYLQAMNIEKRLLFFQIFIAS